MIDLFANTRNHRWFLLLALAACLLLVAGRFYLTRSVLGGDAVYYYSSLRSMAIDRDLDLANEYQHYYHEVSPYTGNRKLINMPPADSVTGRAPAKYPL